MLQYYIGPVHYRVDSIYIYFIYSYDTYSFVYITRQLNTTLCVGVL